MGPGEYASVAVVDASGRTIGSIGGEPDDPLEGPGIERIALPGGGYLIARGRRTSEAWSRYSRAFVHEARSPLNALTLYLEILNTRLAGVAVPGKEGTSPEKLLAKATDQVRRVEELLRAFGDLWGARGESTNLSEMVAAISRFSEHEALRHGLTFSSSLAPSLGVDCSPHAMANALVLLLGAVFRAPADSRISVTLERQGERAVLSVEVGPDTVKASELLLPGAEALRAVGGDVQTTTHRVTASFPRRVEPEPE